MTIWTLPQIEDMLKCLSLEIENPAHPMCLKKSLVLKQHCNCLVFLLILGQNSQCEIVNKLVQYVVLTWFIAPVYVYFISFPSSSAHQSFLTSVSDATHSIPDGLMHTIPL